MARTPPGKTRERVYHFVEKRLLAGEAPTVREVQIAMGFSAVESARRHLEKLVAEGRLTKVRGQARGYRLPRGASSEAIGVRVPLLGQVAAGPLTEAIELAEGSVLLEARSDAKEHFALRVEGESMVGAGLLPGDVVIVRAQADARSGQIVVARVGGEATLKRLKRRGARIELLAENPKIADIVPEPGTLQILGVVVELRRSFRS